MKQNGLPLSEKTHAALQDPERPVHKRNTITILIT